MRTSYVEIRTDGLNSELADVVLNHLLNNFVGSGPSGHKHFQLLKAMNAKGGDDLRQDAVMEQVFGVANRLLRNNAETRRRNLRIRTYKVVPMTPSVGVLEWCDNTQPIGSYLLGSRGAHQRYRSTDWTAEECRKKMRALQVTPSAPRHACASLNILRYEAFTMFSPDLTGPIIIENPGEQESEQREGFGALL
eukprot:SAG11_NODE_3190_length_2623_cov_2.275357_5_plen_193_part_00